jgi:hypothetical protein
MSIRKTPSRLKATMFRKVASYILLEQGYEVEKIKRKWYDFIAKKDEKSYKVLVVSKGLDSQRTFCVLKRKLRDKIDSNDVLVMCIFEKATSYDYYIFSGEKVAHFWKYKTDSNLLLGHGFIRFSLYSSDFRPIAHGEVSKFDFDKEKKIYSYMTVVNSERSIRLPKDLEPGMKTWITIEVLPYR